MTAAGDTSPTEDRNIVKKPRGVYGDCGESDAERPARGRAF